jgi:hypothetical protein
MKVYSFVILFFLFSIKSIYAQPTQGSSTYYSQSQMQQFRETAEMNRHYESMKPSGSSSATPYNYKANSGKPININEYLKNQLNYTSQGEIEAMNIRARKEAALKLKEQQASEWKRQMDDFNSWLGIGMDESLPLPIRIESYNKAYEYAANMNNKVRASWKGSGPAPQADLSLAHMNLGILLARNGEYEKANKHLGWNWKDETFIAQRSWFGFSLLMTKNYSEAIYRYKQLVEKCKVCVPLLSYAYFTSDKPDEAIKVIDQYFVDPDTSQTAYFIEKLQYYKIGLLLVQDKNEEASSLFGSLGYTKLYANQSLEERVVLQFSKYISEELGSNIGGASLLFKIEMQKILAPGNLDILYSSYLANKQFFREEEMERDRIAIDKLGGDLNRMMNDLKIKAAALAKSTPALPTPVKQQPAPVTEKLDEVKKTVDKPMPVETTKADDEPARLLSMNKELNKYIEEKLLQHKDNPIDLEAAISKLNKYLEKVQNSLYKYAEVKKGVMIVYNRNNSISRFPLKDLADLKITANRNTYTNVSYYCKDDKNCVYHSYFKQSTSTQDFFMNAYFEPTEMAYLLADILIASGFHRK